MTKRLDQLSIFLSYARDDGEAYARRFFERLPQRSSRLTPWYDRLIPADVPFLQGLELALSTADVMIVVLTETWPHRDWCRREMLVADGNQKIRIMVAQMHPGVDVPLELKDLTPLDFARRPRAAWAKLVADLERDATPGGSGTPELAEADRRLDERVRAGLRRDQTATTPVRATQRMRLVNEMPDPARTRFRDRVAKLTRLDRALSHPDVRLVLLTGAGGIGKTALLAEVRDRLTAGAFRAPAEAFVYLAAGGYRRVSAGTLLGDLGRVITGADAAGRLGRELQRRQPWLDKLDAVLTALGGTSVVVAVDDADRLLGDDGRYLDDDLGRVIGALVDRAGHGIRLLMTGRPELASLCPRHEPHVEVCDLDEGLPPRMTRPFLRQLDHANELRFGTARKEDIDRLAVVSNGNPRFLELLYCLLRGDTTRTIGDVLDVIAPEGGATTHDEAAIALLGRVLAGLSQTQRRVVQALAVHGRPVRPEALDHLLQDYVAGIDSAPALQVLAERRLVRRDGDRYFLPPSPDAHLILGTVPPAGADAGSATERPFTQPFLQTRAADFYRMAGDRPGRRITGLDDLQPQFNQIELLLAAGAYGSAVDAMEKIDDRYLTRWGQSGVLNGWREEIEEKIDHGRLRAVNLSYLISARAGDEDHTGYWTAALIEAMHEPWTRGAPEDRIRLTIQLADVLMSSGELSAAAEQYDDAARRSRRKNDMRNETATARVTRGLCLARLGRFPAAAREFDQARDLVPKLGAEDRPEVQILLALNEGWALGQQGDTTRALSRLAAGRSLAAGEDVLLEGRILDGQAALHCDRKDPAAAVGPAIRAAEIGVRTGNSALSRNANVTLALAYLLAGSLVDADAAVGAAVREKPGIQALAARAVQGVVRFRQGKIDEARAAFHAACTEGWLRLDRESGEYATYDALGLALTGLELCGEPHRLGRAVEAYRTARQIAPVAGARRRATSQLELFGRIADARVLDLAKRAADGDKVAATDLRMRS